MDRIGLAIIIVGAVVLMNGAAAGRAYAAPLTSGLGFTGPAVAIAEAASARVTPAAQLELETKASTRLLVESDGGLGSADGATSEFQIRG